MLTSFKPSLLDRLGSYLYHRTFRKAVQSGHTFGDYVIVPQGYEGFALHKRPGELADPLQQSETLGWKLRAKKCS